ncbi:MAG: hypothetical protein Q6354_09210 [Candidatus Brocadiales bacterium]|nr:hypothetical protein [Candidatus Brocadiales bacterium]
MSRGNCSSYWKPSSPKPLEVKCPGCGRVSEIWSDEEAVCQCGQTLSRGLTKE